jgi:hypothetical protein
MMKTLHTLARLLFLSSLVAVATAAPASAQTALNNRTVMTFSQPVEVPGKILPAGTYTFEMNDAGMNRHVIQIMDAGGTKLVALVLAIPSYRAAATEETVVKFAEVMPGQPQAIRQWYYPGQTTGNEMVYSKTRARELAVASNVAVAAADDTLYVDSTMDTMKTADVVSVTPAKTEEPVRYQAPPTPAPSPVATAPRKALPRTAGTLPLVMFAGAGLVALGLMLRGLTAAKVAR